MTKLASMLSAASALLVAQAGAASASQLLLGPATYSEIATGIAAKAGGFDSSTGPDTVQYSGSGGLGSAQGLARATPVQFVYASGSVTENADASFTSFVGEGESALSYSFEIFAPPLTQQPILMNIRANGAATASGEGEGDGFFVLIKPPESSGGQGATLISESICTGLGCSLGAEPDFALRDQIYLLTNTPYLINLAANAGAVNIDGPVPFTGQGTALIDPYISFDPSVVDPSQYSLVFSPGIINEPLAGGVPEPSTWLLLLAGFAALPFAAVRRRARSTAA